MDFFKHDVSEQDIQAVASAIREGHLTTGHCLNEFKTALKERFRFPNVEICSSGTAALHLTLHALGVGPGDEVITTPYVGVWTSNPILMVGATPVYADIDRGTYNLCPKSVASRITPNTKAVIPVSVNGVPVDLKGLRKVVPSHIRIICDDIEALGSTRDGAYVGEDIGMDISVGGFWTSKQVTTCGGGMVVSEDLEFLRKFEGLTRHGHGLYGDMWNQQFGFNYWLSDPMAAMGVSQVSRLDEKQSALSLVTSLLDSRFKDVCAQTMLEGHTATKFIYLIELPQGVDKRSYCDAMAEKKVPTRPYFNSLLDVPHLKRYASPCPVATEVSGRTVALPYHHLITAEDVDAIWEAHSSVLATMVSQV